jgi:hypothetical protein
LVSDIFDREVTVRYGTRLTHAILGTIIVISLAGCGIFESDEQEPCLCGDVYVDDMENIEIIRSFTISREAWVPASPPVGWRWEDTRRIWWYVKDREVREEDLFTWAESRPGQTYIPVLEIDFQGYRYSQDFVTSDPASDWGGLMHLVSTRGDDYSSFNFIQVWLRQKDGDGGMMHVDMGEISENYYNPWEPDSLHTEDRDGDGELSIEENTGLDGVRTGQQGDDPNDDWGYSGDDYSRINGTEGDPSGVCDTEDLDNDGRLDTDNVHFRFSFDLTDTTWVASQGSKGWRLYRFPLDRADAVGCLPLWDSIKYLRFYFTDVDSPCVFQLAYLQIADISWDSEGIRHKPDMAWVAPGPGEQFEISSKSTRENPDYYPPYDPGRDPQGYHKQERSMALSLNNLAPGRCGSAHRALTGIKDFTPYRRLAFYVHGGDNASLEDLHLFVRVGSDSLNFYEYATGIPAGWKSVEVPLRELRAIESVDPSVRTMYATEVIYRFAETDDGWIAIYGHPSLSEVAWIGAGVVNSGSEPTSSGRIEVWFDDLRLTHIKP